MKFYDLTKPPSGGGGGGASSYNDLDDLPKINGTQVKGNKTGSQLGLQNTLVSGTNIKTINSTSLLDSGDIALPTDIQFNGTSVVTSGVGNITSANIRSVAPACTIITGTTATITANSTYASTVNSSGLVATLVTPSDLTVYSGFIFQLDTTNSASVAFQTDDSTPVSVVISGSPTLATGKKYTVTGQYSILNNAWELWIIEYKAS